MIFSEREREKERKKERKKEREEIECRHVSLYFFICGKK